MRANVRSFKRMDQRLQGEANAVQNMPTVDTRFHQESQVDNYIVEVANGGAIKAYVGITAVVNRRSGESLQ